MRPESDLMYLLRTNEPTLIDLAVFVLICVVLAALFAARG